MGFFPYLCVKLIHTIVILCMTFRLLLILISCLLLNACANSHQDERLSRIAAFVSESPDSAIAVLDSISPTGLSEADRHLYDLLTIKARDKAYITHTSDSLILDVIDYYSPSDGDSLYAEALYYGGRVYSDLGDYPTALKYFQNALEQLPESTPYKYLRSSVLSQTGHLLNKLHLYDEAASYVKDAIKLDRYFNDSVNEVYDLHLLGFIYLHTEKFNLAEQTFKEALSKAKYMSEPIQAMSSVYLAALKSKIGEFDSALSYIQGSVDKVDPVDANSAIAYASEIYYKSGIWDTAYLYSYRLINSSDAINKQIGYRIILSPELRHLINTDTLDRYYSEYRETLLDFLNRNSSQLAINQQSLYNYTLHECERQKAELSNQQLKHWIIGFVILILVLAVIVLYFRTQNQRHIIDLREALDSVERLRRSLPAGTPSPSSADSSAPLPEVTESELRRRLKSELLALYQSGSEQWSVPSIILSSQPYQKLQAYLNVARSISDDDPLWEELEAIVLQSSPQFKTNLNLLTTGHLTSHDLHTALLIKCGMQPSQMAVLLGRSKSTIATRRETLCLKILDEKLGTKAIDSIIRLM